MNKNPNIENLKPFKKGHDPRRNMKGAPKLPELKEVIAEILNEEKSGTTALQAVIKALLTRATKGDVRAAQELLDRYYGKATQKTDMDIKGELKIIRKIING